MDTLFLNIYKWSCQSDATVPDKKHKLNLRMMLNHTVCVCYGGLLIILWGDITDAVDPDRSCWNQCGSNSLRFNSVLTFLEQSRQIIRTMSAPSNHKSAINRLIYVSGSVSLNSPWQPDIDNKAKMYVRRK